VESDDIADNVDQIIGAAADFAFKSKKYCKTMSNLLIKGDKILIKGEKAIELNAEALRKPKNVKKLMMFATKEQAFWSAAYITAQGTYQNAINSGVDPTQAKIEMWLLKVQAENIALIWSTFLKWLTTRKSMWMSFLRITTRSLWTMATPFWSCSVQIIRRSFRTRSCQEPYSR